jgi:hypothetical protein
MADRRQWDPRHWRSLMTPLLRPGTTLRHQSYGCADPRGVRGISPRSRSRAAATQSRGDNGYWNASKMVLLSELAAHLESSRLRIINTPMGQELIAELNSFEVDFTSAGNMRVDVRSKDHHGDLVIATALALWSAVGKDRGRPPR